MNDRIEAAIDRSQVPDEPQNGHAGPPTIQVAVDPRLLELVPGAAANVIIPEQSPDGPHILVYSFQHRIWRGIRLPLDSKWQLREAKPDLWLPGRPT